MTALTTIRQTISDVVATTGIPVVRSVPERFTPPIAVLIPGSPYIDTGDTFGHFNVRHEVVVIAGHGDNETVVGTLGQYVEQAVGAILASPGVFLEQVEQPALFEHSRGSYLSCVISVSVFDDLEE